MSPLSYTHILDVSYIRCVYIPQVFSICHSLYMYTCVHNVHIYIYIIVALVPRETGMPIIS